MLGYLGSYFGFQILRWSARVRTFIHAGIASAHDGPIQSSPHSFALVQEPVTRISLRQAGRWVRIVIVRCGRAAVVITIAATLVAASIGARP